MTLRLPSLLLLCALAPAAQAQVSLGTDGRARAGITQAVDATVVLANGPELGTGSFRLRDSQSFDRIETTQLAFSVPVGPFFSFGEGDAETDPPPRLRALLRFGLGTAETRRQVVDLNLPSGGPLAGRGISPDAEIRLETLSLRGGAGVRFEVTSWFSIEPTFSVAYNLVRGHEDGDLFDRAILLRDFQDRLVDWRSESVSYLPEIRFKLETALTETVELQATLALGYLETHVFSSSNRLQDFRSRSFVGVLLLELDWDTGWAPFLGMNVHLTPGIRYSRVEGEAADGLGTRDIVSLELSVEVDTTAVIPLATRLGVFGAYYVAVDLEGWTIGAAFSF